MSIPSINIRRYRLDDVDALYEAAQESIAEISPWMSWLNDDYTREMAQQWVDARDAAWENDQSYDFVVVDAAGTFLGTVGLNAIDLPAKKANFGYWIRTSAAGRGIATQAGRLLCEFAFRETVLHRLEIVVAVENQRSHRVAQKLGAVREGILRERLWPAGLPQDAVIYSVLKTDSR